MSLQRGAAKDEDHEGAHRLLISKFRDTDLTDIATRKRLVESFVNAVFVYDDKVVFMFNYKDGSKTVTLDEINAELGSDLEGTSPPRKQAEYYARLVCFVAKTAADFIV